MLKTTVKIFTYLVILLLIGFVIKPMPELVHSKPRQLPWTFSSTISNNAQTNYQYLDNGQLSIEITDIPLIDITPKMLHWFYQHLPVSSVQIGSKIMPWYHIQHPFEHNTINVLSPKEISSTGVTNGTLIKKEEWFGPYHNQGTERIILLSDKGMTVNLELAGLTFGKIEHTFTQTPDGTQYKVSTIIGSDLLVIGPLINLIIQYKLFPVPMIDYWIKHQVEEVSNLNAFLPQLYTALKQGEHYQLKLIPKR